MNKKGHKLYEKNNKKAKEFMNKYKGDIKSGALHRLIDTQTIMTNVISILTILLINVMYYYSMFELREVITNIILTTCIEVILYFIITYSRKKDNINHKSARNVALVFLPLTLIKVITSVYYKQFGDLYFYDRLGYVSVKGGNMKNNFKFIVEFAKSSFGITHLVILASLIILIVVNKKYKSRFWSNNAYSNRPLASRIADKIGKWKLNTIEGVITALVIVALITVLPSSKEYITKEFYTSHVVKAATITETKKAKTPEVIVEREVKDEKEDILKYEYLTQKNKGINKYTGLGNGKNLIVIQVESLQDMMINSTYNGQEIMPYLNSLLKEDGSIHFDQYMQLNGLGNTVDAEFISQFSQYSTIDGPAYEVFDGKYLYGLPNMANRHKYHSMFMHGYKGEFYDRDKVYEKLGYKDRYFEEDFNLDEKIAWGLSDESFFNQSFDKIKEVHDRGENVYALLVTLTHHTPFEIDEQYKEIEILPEDKGNIFGNHINTARYTDNAIKAFITKLKDSGIYDESIIAIYGDHFAIPVSDKKAAKSASNFIGREYDYDDMFNIPLILLTPGDFPAETNHTLGSHADFLPTITNVMGWFYETTPMFGKNLLKDETPEDFNAVFSQTYMLKGSFITDDYLFEISRDGIFENSRLIDRHTREKLDVELAREISDKAVKEINLSNELLRKDKIKELREYYACMYIDENGNETRKTLKPEQAVMHAGGGLDNETYLNMIEAFDHHYELGKRYFEMDFTQTSDGILVGNHGWDNYLTKIFDLKEEDVKEMTHGEFMALKGINGNTPTDIDMMIEWLKTHPDAYIITDIKTDNIEGLEKIAKQYPDMIDRFMPQIYKQEEYKPVKNLGYDNIIYTLYMGNDPKESVLKFYQENDIHSITMFNHKYETDGFGQYLMDKGVNINVHTINDYNEAMKFIDLGVKMIYTDFL